MTHAARRRAHGQLRRTAFGRALTQALEVRESGRWLAAWASAARGPRPARTWTVRATGATVVVRHGTSDVATFDEILCANVYAPPPPVERLLAALGRPPRVADLGANVGLFAADAAGRWPGAQITAIEPDRANLASLRRCAGANGGWEIVAAAASTAAGPLRFVAGLGAESHAAGPGEVAAEVPAVDAFAHLAGADLVKIDVEGGEWPLLADPRLAALPARAVVLEHHRRHCPTATPRATAAALLESAGFVTGAASGDPAGVGLLWAWRP